VSVFVHLFAIDWRPPELQADVCARRVSVIGRLGSGRLDLFRPLGRSISFRSLYTAALSIGILHYW